MAPLVPLHFVLLLIIILCSSVLVLSTVPEGKTFQFINQGKFTDGPWSHSADLRRVDPLPSSNPFELFFYRYTTGEGGTDKLVLGLTGGGTYGRDEMLWVWSANRNHPVGENSTLTFTSDGNLVLAESDGRIAWQTNTADKGVTGISMQPNGNLVLHDKAGKFVWQSFNYPSDCLLVGQLLMHSRGKKLVSRASEWDSREGSYSLVIGKYGFIMYVNKSGALVRYAGWEASGLRNVKLDLVQKGVQPTTATFFLTLGFANTYQAANTTFLTPSQPPFIDMTTRAGGFFPAPSPESEAPTPTLAPAPAETPLPKLRPLQRRVMLAKVYFGDLTLMQMRVNVNYSFLRLEPDGNLKMYSFYTASDTHFYGSTANFWDNGDYWENSYAFFGDTVGQCALGSKCGASWSCNTGTCSACPPSGSVGCMINT
ncbi:hypothetical protein MKW94_002400 [Papaver nudicaule]|uniref:Bulb-type lectin domain-containing protein n=1 Tax=Papaver nudicaule TaxID=74823 RepID=A0AA41RXF5_PAPNU|nr:hypothetical protein [Papaver nudicaule]